MSDILSTNEYLAAVSEATRYVYDKHASSRYELRHLFYLQRFANGQHAFSRYEDLLEQSDSSIVSTKQSDIETLRRTLRLRPIPYNNTQTNPITNKELTKYSPANQLLSYINSALDPAQNVKPVHASSNYLFEEPERELCDKLIFTNQFNSRVVVMANAGFGKTTLVHRIALALSSSHSSTSEADLKLDHSLLQSIVEKTTEGIIPCIITLRDIDNKNEDFTSILIKSVLMILHGRYSRIQISEWLSKIQERLLLLIDGLDELPTESVLPFLTLLEQYITSHGNTRIIMTTRVAGIDDEKTRNKLHSLRFRGRTILPLNEQEAKCFCNLWIKETKSNPELINSLDRIQNEAHLRYLREFLRKPLELVMLLQYLPRQSYSSFNRWDLFYNILWAEITNHVKFNNKQSAYDDECKLLGIIAYHMQVRNKQSLSFADLEELYPTIMSLSFYTDVFETRTSQNDITTIDIWNHLKRLAQNIGIVETIEGTHTVTIPLRSYQEYLTAYACCNLCLEENELSPNPSKAIEPYLNDSNWLGVLGFVISEMECSEYYDLDNFLESLYSSSKSLNRLCELMEVDYFNSREAAKSLCRVKLKKLSLDKEEKLLIEKFMTSRSSFSFHWALTVLHREQFEQKSNLFLEAVSYAYLIESMEKNNNPILKSIELLMSDKDYERVIGAQIIVQIACIKLDEDPLKYERIASFDLTLTNDICNLLRELAIKESSYVYVRALTESFVAQIIDSDTASSILDSQLLEIVSNELYSNEDIIKQHIFSYGYLQADYLRFLTNIVNTVGMFSHQIKISINTNDAQWVETFISALYEVSLDDLAYDQIGIALCLLHIKESIDDFMFKWTEEICKGRESNEVKKDHLTPRESYHFIVVKEAVCDLEANYRNRYVDQRNAVKKSDLYAMENNPTDLFIAGDDLSALMMSMRFYSNGHTIMNNNLAFLIRYLKYDTKTKFGVSREVIIESLLYDGVVNHEAYSTMNLALLHLENGNIDAAKRLTNSMLSRDLIDISKTFWYPIMWRKRKDVEGAFVSVLCHRRCGTEFEDYKGMLMVLQQQRSTWLDAI